VPKNVALLPDVVSIRPFTPSSWENSSGWQKIQNYLFAPYSITGRHDTVNPGLIEPLKSRGKKLAEGKLN